MQAVDQATLQAIKSPSRQTTARVSYGIFNVAGKQALSVTASPHLEHGEPASILDGNANPPFLPVYLEQDYVRLDGTFIFAPNSYNEVKMGYWYQVLSIDGGAFADAPTLHLVFSSPQDILGLTFSFDPVGGTYPTVFDIVYKNAAGVVLATDSFTAAQPNTQSHLVVARALDAVKSMDITIHRINAPGRYFKMMQIDIGVEEIFAAGDIFALQIEEETSLKQELLPQNQCKLTLQNANGRFYLENPQGIYGYLQRRQPLQIEAGIIANGQTTYLPLGTYYLKEWQAANDLQATFVAYDILNLLDSSMFYKSQIYQNTAASAILGQIMDSAGITASLYSIDSGLQSVFLSGYLPIMSHKEALAEVLLASGYYAKVDRHGFLRIIPFPQTEALDTLTDDRLLGKASESLDDLVNEVAVSYYKLQSNSGSSQLYKGELTVTGSLQLWVPYSQAPASNVTASVTSGSVSITPYATAALVTVTGNGNITLTLQGNSYEIMEAVLNRKFSNAPAGEESNQLECKEHYLIGDTATAQRVLSNCQTSFSRRFRQHMTIWADPRYELFDTVASPNAFGEEGLRMLEKLSWQFNGGWQLTAEGVKLS